MNQIKAGIVGGAGYAGGELIRILLNHPDVSISFILSSSNAGKSISSVHPDLLGDTDMMFDIVIVDPPAFAKSLSKRHNAVQAYKRLNMMAMSRIKKGGMLFTFSCSQVVDKPLFHNTIVAAAIESGRLARVVHELGQGPDHPVSIFHPEGHYLKGLALYMD